MKRKDTPRISVNKLAEYLEANPLRRKQIILDAKNPQPFKTTRYSDAREILKAYLAGGRNKEIINDAILTFRSKTTNSDFQENDNKNTLELLEIIQQADLSMFDDYQIELNDKLNPLLNISGVAVSVYPDMLLSKAVGKKTKVGLLKIHIRKNDLASESLKIVSTILYKYASEKLNHEINSVDFRMCISFDAFSLRYESAPKSYLRRLQYIETACEEIALWWDKL